MRLWTTFHVCVCAFILYLCMMGSSENQLYETFVNHVVKPDMNREQAALALLHMTHEILEKRNEIWTGNDDLGMRQQFLRGSDIELMVPGACGGFSHVLVKSLQVAGYHARFCQMKVGEVWGGHIVVEAEIEPGYWAVMGPQRETIFRRPDGRLASFADVQHNWGYYKNQVSADYPYRYEDVRYTNWEKLPVIMPMARKFFSLFMTRQELRTFCLRSYFTNLYYTLAVTISIGYVMFLSGRLWLRRALQRRAVAVIPIRKRDINLTGHPLKLHHAS